MKSRKLKLIGSIKEHQERLDTELDLELEREDDTSKAIILSDFEDYEEEIKPAFSGKVKFRTVPKIREGHEHIPSNAIEVSYQMLDCEFFGDSDTVKLTWQKPKLESGEVFGSYTIFETGQIAQIFDMNKNWLFLYGLKGRPAKLSIQTETSLETSSLDSCQLRLWGWLDLPKKWEQLRRTDFSDFLLSADIDTINSERHIIAAFLNPAQDVSSLYAYASGVWYDLGVQATTTPQLLFRDSKLYIFSEIHPTGAIAIKKTQLVIYQYDAVNHSLSVLQSTQDLAQALIGKSAQVRAVTRSFAWGISPIFSDSFADLSNWIKVTNGGYTETAQANKMVFSGTASVNFGNPDILAVNGFTQAVKANESYVYEAKVSVTDGYCGLVLSRAGFQDAIALISMQTGSAKVGYQQSGSLQDGGAGLASDTVRIRVDDLKVSYEFVGAGKSFEGDTIPEGDYLLLVLGGQDTQGEQLNASIASLTFGVPAETQEDLVRLTDSSGFEHIWEGDLETLSGASVTVSSLQAFADFEGAAIYRMGSRYYAIDKTTRELLTSLNGTDWTVEFDPSTLGTGGFFSILTRSESSVYLLGSFFDGTYWKGYVYDIRQKQTHTWFWYSKLGGKMTGSIDAPDGSVFNHMADHRLIFDDGIVVHKDSYGQVIGQTKKIVGVLDGFWFTTGDPIVGEPAWGQEIELTLDEPPMLFEGTNTINLRLTSDTVLLVKSEGLGTLKYLPPW